LLTYKDLLGKSDNSCKSDWGFYCKFKRIKRSFKRLLQFNVWYEMILLFLLCSFLTNYLRFKSRILIVTFLRRRPGTFSVVLVAADVRRGIRWDPERSESSAEEKDFRNDCPDDSDSGDKIENPDLVKKNNVSKFLLIWINLVYQNIFYVQKDSYQSNKLLDFQ
jgi:hypothetical protein